MALVGMRLAVVLVCLLLALAIWRRPAVAHWPLPINLACLVGLTGLLLTVPLRPASDGIHVASVVAASMALYLFIPNRIQWMLAANVYLFLGFLVAIGFWAPLPPGLLLTSLLLLCFVNLLGADRALYEGKARGRNCVVVASRPVPDSGISEESEERPLWASGKMARADTDVATRATVDLGALPADGPAPGHS